MARGFGTTLGVGSSDRIVSNYATAPTQQTLSLKYNLASFASDFDKLLSQNETSGPTINSLNVQSSSIAFRRGGSGSGQHWLCTDYGTATNTWFQYAISFDASSVTNDPVIFIDGISRTVTQAGSNPASLSAGAGNWVVGNNASGSRNIDGRIAEVAIWDVILTPGEMAAVTRGVSPLLIRPGNLQEYLPLIRNTASRLLAAPTVTGTAVQPHPRVFMPRRRIIGVPASSVAHDGASTLAGSGAIIASAALRALAASTFVGDGSLSATAVLRALAAASFSGAGSLSASASIASRAAATFAGAGSLSVNALRRLNSSTEVLAGAGALSATASLRASASAILPGAGALTAQAILRANASALLAGAGSLAIDAFLSGVQNANATFEGAGALSAAASLHAVAAIDLAGAGALSSSATLALRAAATLDGASSLTVDAVVSGVATATAEFLGAGSLSIATVLRAMASATFASASSLAVNAVLAGGDQDAEAHLSASASISALPTTRYEQIVSDAGVQLVYTAEVSLWPRSDRLDAA